MKPLLNVSPHLYWKHTARSLLVVVLVFILAIIFNFSAVTNAQTESNSTSEIAPDELIETFESEIWIQRDRSVDVTETITLRNTESDKIERGIIYRLPLNYQLILVQHNGEKASYKVKKQRNYKTISISDQYLNLGRHTYTIKYQTNPQIKSIENRDQLSWKLIRNHWTFPIQNPKAIIHLPNQLSPEEVNFEAFTNLPNEVELEEETVIFTTTGFLLPDEEITINLTFPQGYVIASIWLYLSQQVSGLLLAFLWIVLLIWLFRKEPKLYHKSFDQDSINSISQPPENLSPSAISYLLNYPNQPQLKIALVSIAIKGGLKIKQETNLNEIPSQFSLIPVRLRELDLTYRSTHLEEEFLYPEERKALQQLTRPRYQNKTIEINSGDDFRILSAKQELKTSLNKQLENKYFPKKIWKPILTISSIIISIYLISIQQYLSIPIFLLSIPVISRLFILPNLEGQELIKQIKGYQRYLNEQNQSSYHYLSKESLEKLLPYLIALGISEKWVKQQFPTSTSEVFTFDWFSVKGQRDLTPSTLIMALSKLNIN